MINYKFKAKDKEETIDAMSLKKALRSLQTKACELKEDLDDSISRKRNQSSKKVKLQLKRRKKKR